jgi:hypothetical protein
MMTPKIINKTTPWAFNIELHGLALGQLFVAFITPKIYSVLLILCVAHTVTLIMTLPTSAAGSLVDPYLYYGETGVLAVAAAIALALFYSLLYSVGSCLRFFSLL